MGRQGLFMKDEDFPETFPSRLLDDLARLEKQYGPMAFRTALKHWKRGGQPPKRSETLVTGVWRIVEMVRHALQINVSEACRLLARHGIIDEMTEGSGFVTGTKAYLDTHRKPAPTWRRLYAEGQKYIDQAERERWRLVTSRLAPQAVKELRTMYEKLPRKGVYGQEIVIPFRR
jgi:hypothetical protein